MFFEFQIRVEIDEILKKLFTLKYALHVMIMHKLKILPQDIRNFKKRNNEKICRYIANPLQQNYVKLRGDRPPPPPLETGVGVSSPHGKKKLF